MDAVTAPSLSEQMKSIVAAVERFEEKREAHMASLEAKLDRCLEIIAYWDGYLADQSKQ